MRLKSAFSTTIFLLLLLTARAQSSLPRSTPEAEGVSSENILRFFNAVSQSKHEFHSFMLLRHGKVVSEGWWNPYRADLKHTMYSVSKSWTSTAVGFAVSEKRLTVQDKVLSFFPEYAPAKVDEKLAALRVKDLLTMSAGYDPEPMGIVGDTNWVRNFLQYVPAKQPGSVFLYNSAATYMLSAIVQKVTGQKVIDYLQPRLFQPLGIQNPDWEVDPKGINVGGWGLRIKTEDMAKPKFNKDWTARKKNVPNRTGCRATATSFGAAATALIAATGLLGNTSWFFLNRTPCWPLPAKLATCRAS
jgi:CubicO group peptidase (beta-lactamase class C family)